MEQKDIYSLYCYSSLYSSSVFYDDISKKKRGANLQAPAIGAFHAGQTNEVCRKELQGFDMLS